MQNINVPGVLPGVIALMLTLSAIRSHYSYRRWQKKIYKTSKILCIIGAVLFYLIAIIQLWEIR